MARRVPRSATHSPPPAAEPPPAEPLPLPLKRRPWLLILAIGLEALWMLLLGLMAWWK